MAQFLSGNVQSNLNLGITSSTENQTVLQVTGKVGIGTTDAQQYALYVAGDTNISGVSSISGVLISSGIVTSSKTSGIVTYYGDGSKLSGIIVNAANYAQVAGVATYATSSGIATNATNVSGGTASVTSLNVSGISTLGTVRVSSGIITATSGVVTYYGDGSKLTNVVTGVPPYAVSAGVATYATSSGIATNATNVIGGIASVSSIYVTGIDTSGNVQISAGIITATTGIVTYYGDGSKLIKIVPNYSVTAGVATNVIGGIASVTSIYVTGIDTSGNVQISAGIITATSGIVTYYGDGSKLIGISGFAVTTQSPVSTPVYLTLASAAGVSTAGISTTKLTFIPSSGSLGVNTSSPRNSLDVIGSIGIQSSGSSNRFHIQHNPTLNSLDFIFE